MLVDIVYGVDFKQIDKMAINLGTSCNDERRIKSSIKYALVLSSYNGHTCVIKENLIQFVLDILSAGAGEVSIEDVQNCLIDLKVIGEVVEDNRDNGDGDSDGSFIYLKILHSCEQMIAEKLVALDKTKNIKKIKNFKAELEKIENKEDIILSSKQREAVEAVNENNVCVITGMPGTGKTTTIRSIIKLYKNNNMKVALCAPTRKSSKKNY